MKKFSPIYVVIFKERKPTDEEIYGTIDAFAQLKWLPEPDEDSFICGTCDPTMSKDGYDGMFLARLLKPLIQEVPGLDEFVSFYPGGIETNLDIHMKSKDTEQLGYVRVIRIAQII